MSIHIIYHSRRISDTAIRKTLSSSFDLGNCVFWATTSEKSGYDCAMDAIDVGARIIVAVGGDGTVNEVGQAIVKRQLQDPELEIRLGIIPRGSGNDLVRSLKITNDQHQLASLIEQEKTFKMDVGVVTQYKSTHYFFNALDAGMGAEAIRIIQSLPRWVGSKTAYTIGILKSMMTYRNRRMRVVLDDQVLDGYFRLNIVSNGSFIGNGHCAAPEGCLDDGLLEVLSVGDVTVLDYLKQLPKLRRREYMDHPEVSYFKVREIEIMGDAHTEFDGEFGPRLPIKVSVLPRALEVFSPIEQGPPVPQT